MGPKVVSIIIPVYNRPILVAAAIDSVLAQTNPNWELIVVDDGSTDNTWAVLESYAAKDEMIRIFKRDREPKGASVCRNIGLTKAQGEFLIFLDSDDLFGPDCLEYRFSCIKKYPDYDAWIFPTAIFRNKPGDTNLQWNKLKTDEDDLIRFLNMDMPWHTSGPIWSIKNKTTQKWFDENAQSMQDWEMHINKLIDGVKYIKIDEGKESIQTYYRKSTLHNSIGADFYSRDKVKQRLHVYLAVLNKVFEKDNLSKQEIKSANRLLTRMAVKMMEVNLKKEAMMLVDSFYYKGSCNVVIKRLFKFYIASKSKRTIFNRSVEFIIYHILRKGYLFDTPASFFMNQKM